MSDSHPLVSILIVSWNARPLLEKCLPSVVATNYPHLEIVVADNASTDDSVAWIRKHYPPITVIQHPENWAFCRGNNEAIPHTSGKYIVLLNNDVEVTPDWLTPLVEEAESDSAIAAIQPKLLQYDDRTRFEYAGASGGYMDYLGYPFTRGRLFDTMEKDLGQYDAPQDIFWATGAAMFLRRTALEQSGLLDEQFYMHMEEIDLCWRLQRLGYRIRVVPQSVVFHIGGGSLPYGNSRKTYYNFRNSLLTLYKNLPPRSWRRTFPRRAALDGLAILRAMLSGNLKDAVAIVRAYKDAHVMSRQYHARRPDHQDNIVLPPYRRSVVLDYFLRKRKQFSTLMPDAFQINQ